MSVEHKESVLKTDFKRAEEESESIKSLIKVVDFQAVAFEGRTNVSAMDGATTVLKKAEQIIKDLKECMNEDATNIKNVANLIQENDEELAKRIIDAFQ